MIEEANVRAELLRFQLDHRGARAWSASRGTTRLEHFFPNPRQHVELGVQLAQRAVAGEEITVTLELAGADARSGVGNCAGGLRRW